jgi:hypothetical protein
MLKIINNICCCCIKDSEENYDDYRLIDCKDKTEIYIKIKELLVKQDYNSLSQIEVYDIYNFVCNLSLIDEIITWKLRDQFIVILYKKLYKTNKITNFEIKYIHLLIKRLITVFLFFETKYNLKCINFLRSRNKLFDLRLWLSLLLNPKYSDDESKLSITIQLAKNDILHIYKPIKFYNLEYTIFEFIIIGKLVPNNNLLEWIRFFDLKSVINFIEQLFSNIFDSSIINILTNINKKQPDDKVYIDTIIILLTNKLYNY